MKLPANVHKKGPSLYYVKSRRIQGKLHTKWSYLCSEDASEEVLHRELWKLLRQGVDTLGDVMSEYKAHRLPNLAVATQKDYDLIIETRLRPWCGHMRPDDLTSQDVAVYLETRDQAGHGARGNREISVLSSIYNHAMRIRAASHNPTYGVRRNREQPRTYYVTDESLRLAMRHSTPALRHLMWATYLTGFRQKDMRSLTRDNLTNEGIKIVQSKDGKYELREWTESLRKVVRRALECSKNDYVFTNSYGRHWTVDAIQCAMRRMKQTTGIKWRFHDLRAKAESDHETGLGLMRRYTRVRKLRAVK